MSWVGGLTTLCDRPVVQSAIAREGASARVSPYESNYLLLTSTYLDARIPLYITALLLLT